MKDLKVIPTTNGILKCSEDGDIYENGTLLPHTSQTGGYVIVSHHIPNLTRRRHRLVAMAWKELPDNYLDLVVNHLDNTPGNDWAGNLEWTTQKGNMTHSKEQFRLKNIPYFYKFGLTGEVEMVKSLPDLSAATGCSEESLRMGLSKEDIHSHSNGYIISVSKKLLEDKISYTLPEVVNRGSVIVRYFDNDLSDSHHSSISSFANTSEAKDLGLGRGSIYRYLRMNGSMVLPNVGIYFKLGEDFIIIPRPDSPSGYDVLLRAPSQTTYVKNVLTGDITTHESIKKASESHGLCYITARNRCGIDSTKPLLPHHRITTTSPDIFPEVLSRDEIFSLGEYVLKDPGNNVVIKTSHRSKYIQCIKDMGWAYASIHKIEQFNRHIAVLREKGYMLNILIGGVDYIDEILNS